ncbi:MAG TPA: NAD(P)/FAD-dependent oxidoreductase, partial [Terriglobales bacterium]
MAERFDAIVLGAGAAGLMCAMEAGKRGRRVIVLDRAEKIGKKILISGGGRCNFTNLHCTPANFLSKNPHFCKSALARYAPADFISLVEKHNIPYHEKTLGQLFCDRSARDIVHMLETECGAAGVRIVTNVEVRDVTRGDAFVVCTQETEFTAPALVIACGGLSIPKMGATGLGYELARQFGLKIVTPRPALVPFTFNPADRENYCDLTGLSAEVVVSSDGAQFREKMLITHKGLSGPAILQISSYWKAGTSISLDLAPGVEVTRTIHAQPSGRTVASLKAEVRKVLPQRFADRWTEFHEPKNWTNQALEEFERAVHAWQVTPAGTEGFEKAEVTAGGVDTDELSAKTMESRKVPG